MTSNLTDNITGRFKSILAIHKPSTVEEVRQLVLSSRARGVPLYPISTGFNWGYGSRSPVTENCELVDLGKMKRILNEECISIDNPIAVIEPGVTQLQLYEFLQTYHPELKFDVTGSSQDTSIIGNALDRGVGYIGPRKENIFGLEIVTGAGDIIYTGFRRLGESSALAHTHPYGLGPVLDGLFFQSNFGIVTSACFRLIPRRPKEVVISLSLREDMELSSFINELARLKRDGLLTSVTHIANREKSNSLMEYGIISYLEKECGFNPVAATKEANRILNLFIIGEWTSIASITGNSAQVKAALKEIRSRTRSFGYLKVLTNELLNIGLKITNYFRSLAYPRSCAALISAMMPYHNLALGIPTNVSIESLLWKFNSSDKRVAGLDRSKCGLLFINPALPLDGKITAGIINGMKLIARQYNFPLYITINIETSTSLVAITNMLFNRSSQEEINRAHDCSKALLDYIHNNNLEIYRARADIMQDLVKRDKDYWEKIFSLKKVFDPNNIIAPGRYSIFKEV